MKVLDARDATIRSLKGSLRKTRADYEERIEKYERWLRASAQSLQEANAQAKAQSDEAQAIIAQLQNQVLRLRKQRGPASLRHRWRSFLSRAEAALFKRPE